MTEVASSKKSHLKKQPKKIRLLPEDARRRARGALPPCDLDPKVLGAQAQDSRPA